MYSADPRPSVHIRIRDLRRARSLTQEDLADALGLSRQSINAMEAGRCLPSLPVAMQLAAFFSVPLGEMFELMNETEDGVSVPSWATAPDVRRALSDMISNMTAMPVPQWVGPAANCWHTEHAVWVELRLPGYRTEEIHLEATEDTLTVSGEPPREHGSERAYVRREFSVQPFIRTISLPAPVVPDRAEASMRNGILLISLYKRQPEQFRPARIQISSLD